LKGSKYWEKKAFPAVEDTPGGTGAQAKKGVSSSKAISEFFEKKGDWVGFDCRIAVSIVFKYAIMKTMPDQFDANFVQLGFQQDIKARDTKTSARKITGYTDLIPGDSVVFTNPNLKKNHIFRNQNAIYVGKNAKGEPLFYAHGPGKDFEKLLTGAELISVLAAHSGKDGFELGSSATYLTTNFFSWN
jgi:hypothetical protein